MISNNSHAVKHPYSRASSNASFVTPYASLDLPKPSTAGVRPSSVHAQSIAGKCCHWIDDKTKSSTSTFYAIRLCFYLTLFDSRIPKPACFCHTASASRIEKQYFWSYIATTTDIVDPTNAANAATSTTAANE